MNKTDDQRTICITGCSQGIGYSLVKTFLDRGDNLVFAITRKPEKLRVIKASYPDRLVIIDCDICNETGRDMAWQAMRHIKNLDLLVHNAGSLLFKEFKDIKIDELEYVYRINVFAPFMLTQKLLPILGRSHVINISSIGGVEGSLKFKGLSAYSSSKAALNCLTEMWSEEFKETEIAFNCLALGSVGTEMFKDAFPGFEASSTVEEMANYIFSFALNAPKVMRGKIISVSKSNP